MSVSSRSIPSGSPSSSVSINGVRFVADSPGAISPNSTTLVDGSIVTLPLVDDNIPMVPSASSEPKFLRLTLTSRVSPPLAIRFPFPLELPSKSSSIVNGVSEERPTAAPDS